MKRSYIWITIVCYVFVFGLISLVNHFTFRSTALDYGMFNQAMFSFSHGERAIFTQSIDGSEVNYLCDHFSPIIIFLSPLQFLFGSYALLLFQIFTIAFGAYYVYKLALLREFSERWAILFSSFFLSIWGVSGAVSFDFHTNVIAAVLIPAIWYFFEMKKWKTFVAIIFLGLLCKENVAILYSSMLFVLAIGCWNLKPHRLIALFGSLLSVLWFLLVIFILMPNECGSNKPNVEGFYSTFGDSFGDAFVNMLLDPLRVFRLFFETPDGSIAKTKVTTYIWFIFSGGLFVLLSPRFLIVLIPLFAQKFLSANTVLWDINGHYSIEFVPLIVLAAMAFFSKWKDAKWSLGILIVSVVLALNMSWRGVVNKSLRANVFDRNHYSSLFERNNFIEMQVLIPSNIKLCCTSPIAPHVSNRNWLKLIPHDQDAEMILVHKKWTETYPLSVESYQELIYQLQSDTTLIVLKENNDFILFSRR